MQKILGRWRHLTFPLRLGVGALVWGALLGIGYLGFYQPKVRAVEELRREVQKHEATIRRRQETLRLKPLPLPPEREDWERVRMLLRLKVPPQEDMPRMLEEIVKVVGSASVAAIEFPETEKGRAQVPARTLPIRGSPSLAAPPARPGASARKEEKELTLESSLVRITFHVPFEKLGLALRGILSGSRWVELESLKVERDAPQVRAELTLRAYYGRDGTAF